ncbi:MAG: hypothetical protein HOY75_08195 [Streptomyces sp.]|nr:hypothetical protein [Streptomyces sp.]
MTTILTQKAVRGRRVTYAYPNTRQPHPGVITNTQTIDGNLVALVRLDGTRSNLHLPADQENLTYLDQVGPVPDLPMGRFQPDSSHPGFDFQYEGVLVCSFEDDDAAAVTGDPAKAQAALAAFLREYWDYEDEGVIRDQLKRMDRQWVVFEWQPEDAEYAWMLNPAAEDDDQAVQVHYLYAIA